MTGPSRSPKAVLPLLGMPWAIASLRVSFGVSGVGRMEFRILGPLEVKNRAGRVKPGGAKLQSLLGALLLRANEVVSARRLIDELWGESPPATAGKLVQGYVCHLRKALGGSVIVTRAGGYLVRVDAGELDAARFQRLAAEGATFLDVDPARAAQRLREALALWRGSVLEGLELYGSASHERQRWAEQRLAVVEQRIEAELALGRHAALVGELRALVAEHPYRENMRRQLMLALYKAGRQAEALAVYRDGRRVLARELGLELGEPLRELELRILRHDPALGAPARPGLHPPLPAADPAAAPADARRRRPALVTLLTGVVAAAVCVPVIASDEGRSGPGEQVAAVAGNSVAVVDPGSGRLVADVRLGTGPADVTAASRAVWVTNPDSATVTRIDRATRTVRQTIRVGDGPSAIAAGAGAIWVANGLRGTVSRIDSTTNDVVQTIAVGNGPSGIAVGYGSVWVANRDDHTVSQIDPSSGKARIVEAGYGPIDVAAGLGAIWVTSEPDGKVVKIDPITGRVVDTANVGRGPGAITVGAGAVWVANVVDGTVSRIDPAETRVTRVIPVGEGPAGVTASGGSVWVTSEFGHMLSRLDPVTGAPLRVIQIGGRPAGIAATPEGLFVAVRPAGGAHRGGTFTALMGVAAPPGSIDPAVSFDTVTSGLLSMAYDGLTAFRRAGGTEGTELVPDLAASIPQPANAGRSYTFVLRPAIRYSTGELVRAADFRRGLERMFELRSPAAYEYTAIIGARGCTHRPSRCDLSSGIVTDDRARTVTFRLTRPDLELPDKLALTAAAPVPPSAPFRATGHHPLPATGAYMIASYARGRQLRFVRNPRFRTWSLAARPAGYPDQLIFYYGAYRPRQLRAVITGQADFVWAPPANLARLRPLYPSRVHSNIRLGAWYVFLNTRLPPFNNIRVRRAVSYAIDRHGLVQAAGGPLGAQPTCQILPPNFPGYRRYCPYRHDLAQARRLVAASGTRGMPVVVWSPSSAMFVMSPIVSALNALGYRARLNVDDDEILNHHEIQAGPHTWFSDYPAAADFAPLYSCRSPALANPAHFCDSAIEQAVHRALGLEPTDPRAANDLWAQIDRMVTDRAPYVPLLNPRRMDFVSARVGNYQFSPQWGTLFDQLWVR